jgi:diguanylate cyclase (GGDEF)-like protein/PAS domain S-box-containing protein
VDRLALLCCGQVHDEVTRRHFHQSVRVVSALVVAAAVLVLAGHALGIEALQTLGVGRAPATPAAAGMLIGLGVAVFAAGEGHLAVARTAAGAAGVWALLGLVLTSADAPGVAAWLPYVGGALVVGALAVSLLAAPHAGVIARRIRAVALAMATAVSVPALIVALHNWELAERLPPPLDIAGPAALLSMLLCAALSALAPHRWPNRLFYRTPDDLPLLTRVVTLAFAAPLLLPILQRLGRAAGLSAEYAGLVAQLMSAGLMIAALVTVVEQRQRLASRLEAQRRELAEAEEQFRRMFEHAPIGMATVDLDGRLRKANQAFCELLGRRAHELEDVAFIEFTHPDDVRLDMEHFEACLRGELDRYHIEKRYRHASGEWIVGELSVALVPDEQGRPHHFVSQIVDRTRERALEADLWHAAHHDPLTGLANRRLLEERFLSELARAARQGGAVGLVVVDLDGFKAINDQYGHPMGDAVLAAVSQRLVEASRGFDIVARTGGDEFAVCAALSGPSELPELAERIRRAVNQPFHHSGAVLHLSGSVGAVVGGTGASLADLFRLADQRMYATKHNGRRPS